MPNGGTLSEVPIGRPSSRNCVDRMGTSSSTVAATFTMPSTMLPSTGSSRETAGDACCTYADSLVVPGAGADCQVSGRAVSAGCSACRLVPLPASPRTASVPAGVSTATQYVAPLVRLVAVLTPAGTLAVRGDAGSGTSRQA